MIDKQNCDDTQSTEFAAAPEWVKATFSHMIPSTVRFIELLQIFSQLCFVLQNTKNRVDMAGQVELN